MKMLEERAKINPLMLSEDMPLYESIQLLCLGSGSLPIAPKTRPQRPLQLNPTLPLPPTSTTTTATQETPSSHSIGTEAMQNPNSTSRHDHLLLPLHNHTDPSSLSILQETREFPAPGSWCNENFDQDLHKLNSQSEQETRERQSERARERDL